MGGEGINWEIDTDIHTTMEMIDDGSEPAGQHKEFHSMLLMTYMGT